MAWRAPGAAGRQGQSRPEGQRRGAARRRRLDSSTAGFGSARLVCRANGSGGCSSPSPVPAQTAQREVGRSTSGPQGYKRAPSMRTIVAADDPTS